MSQGTGRVGSAWHPGPQHEREGGIGSPLHEAVPGIRTLKERRDVS